MSEGPKMSEPQYVEAMRAEIARLQAQLTQAEAVVRAGEELYRRLPWDALSLTALENDLVEKLGRALAAVRERA